MWGVLWGLQVSILCLSVANALHDMSQAALQTPAQYKAAKRIEYCSIGQVCDGVGWCGVGWCGVVGCAVVCCGAVSYTHLTLPTTPYV